MLAKIEDFFMNHILGKVIASGAASVVAFAASGKLGAQITLDPAQVAAVVGFGAHAILDFVQHWRQPVAAEAAAAQAIGFK